ncbi:MAG: DNA adenine methylase [Saprospiraceae bacterium]|nr:DNA adenine methylase [Saprospiraceae bacterium]
MFKNTKKKVQIYLRPPASYYGGKQQLLTRILAKIPEHRKYDEPFLGGGAVYWSKKPSEIEIINDLDGFVTNFYRVIQSDFEALKRLVDSIPYSREAHDEACVMRQFPNLFTDVQKAWSFFFMANTSMFSILGNIMNTPSRDQKPIRTFLNKVDRFTDVYAERLKSTFIENRNALYVIKTHDGEDTFHFIDPPYFNSDCGHYGGYTHGDFETLLILLGTLQGKFMLTCYPSDLLNQYVALNGWHVECIEMQLSASKIKGKKKVECLVTNY